MTDNAHNKDQALAEQRSGPLRDIVNERVAAAEKQGYVRFNSVSRIASVLEQMLRHVREQHGHEVQLKELVIKLPETEVAWDQHQLKNVLVSTWFIEGWIYSLAEICLDATLSHDQQQNIYADAVKALRFGLTGDLEKTLAFIGCTELARER